jgi:ADP-ribose pyrophosphatase YjhB (NUDIX family)
MPEKKVKNCDNTSVGIVVYNTDGKLLLIERKKFPPGFALPAGHVDADKSYEDAARRELQEETGLIAKKLELVGEGRKENKCRRPGGDWHYWKIYKAEVEGAIKKNEDETKGIDWFSPEQIKRLAERTEDYLYQKISEDEWVLKPGLEPVMYEWFKELQIL